MLCLRHWNGSHPWSDLDVFSGGFFGVTLAVLVYQTALKLRVLRCPEILREASGSNYDPGTVVWGSALFIFDLVIFLDYGHWHSIPVLRRPPLQAAGLMVYTLATLALIWTDTHLARYFSDKTKNRELLSAGPFAVVRHPRYASLLLAKLGIGLIFASIFAWMSLIASILLYRRRIRLEEAHLMKLFGAEYRAYAERIPAMLPRIYRSSGSLSQSPPDI